MMGVGRGCCHPDSLQTMGNTHTHTRLPSEISSQPVTRGKSTRTHVRFTFVVIYRPNGNKWKPNHEMHCAFWPAIHVFLFIQNISLLIASISETPFKRSYLCSSQRLPHGKTCQKFFEPSSCISFTSYNNASIPYVNELKNWWNLLLLFKIPYLVDDVYLSDHYRLNKIQIWSLQFMCIHINQK